MYEQWVPMPSPEEWTNLSLVLAGILAAIGLSEALRKIAHLHPEFSRKMVHVGIGFGILLAPRLFVSPVPLLLLSMLFAFVDWFAIRKGWLKGIHGPRRRSYGTVYFPVSLFVLTLLFWQRSPDLVVLSMFSFSLGDAAAALVGESIRNPSVIRLTGDAKSLQGSAGMFMVSLAATVSGAIVLWHPILPSWSYLFAIGGTVAVVSTAAEALSSKGLDNLSVPFVNALVLSVFLLPTPLVPAEQLMVAVLFSGVVSILSYRLQLLTMSGSVATFLLATLVYGLGGWKWTIPILAFFIFSSLLSVWGRRAKKEVETVFEKGSTRDHAQVAANGGVAGVLLILQYAFPSTELYPAYIGSLAAVTADTWGTEVGVLTRGRTMSLLTRRDVPRGTNGGVSLAGTFAGACGALVIAVLGWQWSGNGGIITAGLFGGVVGSVVDSILGETIQARCRCPVCGKETEKDVHCGEPARHTKGYRWMRNDAVNLMCALSGGLTAWLLTSFW